MAWGVERNPYELDLLALVRLYSQDAPSSGHVQANPYAEVDSARSSWTVGACRANFHRAAAMWKLAGSRSIEYITRGSFEAACVTIQDARAARGAQLDGQCCRTEDNATPKQPKAKTTRIETEP